MDEVLFVVVGVGVMFFAVVPIFLLVFVMTIHEVLEMLGSLILSSVFQGLVLLLFLLWYPSMFQFALYNYFG